MNAQKLTQKSLEALQEAQSIASRNSNQAVDQQHLMLALLSQENGLVPQLFVKMDIAPENIEAALTRAVDDIPKVQEADVHRTLYTFQATLTRLLRKPSRKLQE